MSLFQLYLTDSGYKIIENPIMIGIADAVENESKTFTEIVQATEQPRSTVSTYLKKLVELGIVSVSETDPSKNGKTYILNGNVLVKLTTPRTDFSDPASYLLSNHGGIDQFPKYFLRQISQILERGGLTLNPLLNETLGWVGTLGRRLQKPSSFEVALGNLQTQFYESEIAEVQVIGQIPLTLKVTALNHVPPTKMMTLLEHIGTLYASYLRGLPTPHTAYRVGKIEAYGGEGGTIRLDLNVPDTKINHHARNRQSEQSQAFHIYWTGTEFQTVSKKLELGILDILDSEGCCTIKHLSEILSTSLSTVADCIHKLEQKQILCQSSSGPQRAYRIYSTRIFGGKITNCEYCESFESTVNKIWADPRHFVKHVVEYQYLSAKYRHFNLDNLLKLTIFKFVDRLCEVHPESDVMDLISILSRNSRSWFSMDIGIKTANPLSLNIVSIIDLTEHELDIQKIIFENIICRIMEKVTGIKHEVSEYRAYRDYNALNMTFSPSENNPNGGGAILIIDSVYIIWVYPVCMNNLFAKLLLA